MIQIKKSELTQFGFIKCFVCVVQVCMCTHSLKLYFLLSPSRDFTWLGENLWSLKTF